THRAAQKVAINQMRGGFSVELTKLRGELLHFIAMIELELDFSEEDVEFADRDQLKKLVSKIEAILRKLKDSFQLGNVIKNGIPVAIVGDTNVDTAGLRETSDTIETMGIARSYSKLDQATIVILVVDSCSDFNTISTSVEKIKERLNQQHLIVVANKIDRAKHENFAQLAKLKLRENDQLILIAAKQKTNIEQLIEVMQKTVSPEALQDDAVVVTNVRHFEALSNAHDSIERVQTGLENRISGD
ncbi:50S ribosome-binding GTPase, partial [bacterium]|nr:50S ribosome-binding GTPase [bacterium]